GPGDLRPRRRPDGPRPGDGLRAPRRDDRSLARDLRDGHLSGGGPARLDLDDPLAARRRRRPLPLRPRRAGRAPEVQGPPGHHRDPGHRRALGGRQAHRRARAQDPALPLAALLRGPAVHGPRGPLRQDRRHDQGLPRDRRRQVRRHARAGVLHGGHDRGGAGEGRAAGEGGVRRMPLQLVVVTPERQVVETEADEVQLPGSEGYLGILPGHAPLITLLKTGVLSYKGGGRSGAYAVSAGFAEVLDDRVSVLADSAQGPGEIDAAAAERERAKAEEEMKT